MKTNRKQLKAEFLAEAEELFDQLMEWDENTSKPGLTQIEEVVLQLRQRLGEQMAQAVIARQESRQPAERLSCAQCGGELEPKGQKGNQVESRLGDIRVERSYYYCPGCRQGFSPLDQQLKLWEKHWSEQVAKLALWLSGLVTFAQAEQILREVGQINMSQSSVWRRVERWGGRLQGVEALQQAKAMGSKNQRRLI